MYNKIVLDHFQNPRNLSELKSADAFGMGANPTCGDVLKLYLKIEKGTIKNASFKTMGCGAAIASGSILTEHLKGKSLKEAAALKPNDLVKLMGGLPPIKLHCPELAINALNAALQALSNEKTKSEKASVSR